MCVKALHLWPWVLWSYYALVVPPLYFMMYVRKQCYLHIFCYLTFKKMVERMIKLNKLKVTIRFKFVYFAWRFFKKSHALGVMFQLTCNYIWTNQMIIDACKNICEYKKVLNNISKTLSRANISNRVHAWLGHPIWNTKRTPRTSQIYLLLCKI